MGNMFSTRWTGVQTRLDTGRAVALDLATLRRLGALTPEAVIDLAWIDARGTTLATVRTQMHETGVALTVWHAGTIERFRLAHAPCNYGGQRVYVTCPGCNHRRRVLYSVAGVFRCRACHDLAYTSTREEPADRARRRRARLYARLGTVPASTIPPKPPGMHRATYRGIVRQLRAEHARQAAMLRTFLGTHRDALGIAGD